MPEEAILTMYDRLNKDDAEGLSTKDMLPAARRIVGAKAQTAMILNKKEKPAPPRNGPMPPPPGPKAQVSTQNLPTPPPNRNDAQVSQEDTNIEIARKHVQ